MFRTIPIGTADPKHFKMHEACVEALRNCEKKLKPGNKVGEVFDVHAKTFDDLGYNKARMNACGYSLELLSHLIGWIGQCFTRAILISYSQVMCSSCT